MYESGSGSDSSDDGNKQPKCLPVGPLPRSFDPNKTPATAEEYLQQVM